MKKIILVFCFYLLSISNVFGQQPKTCQIKIADSPAVRGFSLRSRTIDIQKAFPKLDTPSPDKFGVSNLTVCFDCSVSYGQDEEKTTVYTKDFPQYKGLDKIDFEILDNQVVIFTLEYESSVKWKSLAEFTNQISDILKLPKEWNYIGYYEFQSASLSCVDFKIESEISNGNPILRFVKNGATEIYKKRKLEIEEKEKKDFKP